MTNKRKKGQSKRMDSKRNRKRSNVEPDRLSSLPDDLIHIIFSSIGIKQVVETSVLSSRWRYVWTSMPYLDFSSEDFSTLPQFSNFVKHFLSGRNNQIEVSFLKLSFRGKASQVFVNRLMNYVFSHNVQEMTVTCLEKKIEFPLSLFNSQSLKHLTLRGSGYSIYSLTVTSTLELPSLTTLHLDHVMLSDDSSENYIGKCTKLRNLTLCHCHMKRAGGISICHPQLSNLTLTNEDINPQDVNVAAPHLKNLSILYNNAVTFCSDGFPLLKKVDLCFTHFRDASEVILLLQQFQNVEFLTFNVEIIERLSSSMDRISKTLSPFANLKSLKIYPKCINLMEQPEKKVHVSTVVENYFLASSPSATFTMVSREECRAARNATLALEHIPNIQVLLNELKTDLDQGKTPMVSHKAIMHNKGRANGEKQRAPVGAEMIPHSGGTMKHIESCWDDLSQQMFCETERVSHIFSKLRNLEGLLTELPASKKVKVQACFASMCGEANTLMNKITESMKIQCDLRRNHLSTYFRELAKELPSSS